MRLKYVPYGDGYDINGTALMDSEWYLVSISEHGLGRYRSVGGGSNYYGYDREGDHKLKIIGVDMV